jgi:hypothetical protein
MYLPQRSLISEITNSVQAVVTVSSVDGLSVGQFVRFILPVLFGMQQLNGSTGKILSVDTGLLQLVVGVNTTNMDPFIFYTGPLDYTPAQLIPFADGLDPSYSWQTSATLSGSTRNIL